MIIVEGNNEATIQLYIPAEERYKNVFTDDIQWAGQSTKHMHRLLIIKFIGIVCIRIRHCRFGKMDYHPWVPLLVIKQDLDPPSKE